MTSEVFEVFKDGADPISGEATKVVGRLTDMDTEEVSLVDRAANQRKFLVVKRDEVAKAPTKTEGGKAFPAGAFAFVPDPTKPSTWKLKLFDEPGDVPGKPSVRLTAAAAQALAPSGFRGQQVQLPADALAGVKAKVRAAWLKARADKPNAAADLPAVIKSQEDTVAGTTDTKTDPKPDSTKTDAVEKHLVAARVDEALNRVAALKGVVAGAADAEVASALPAAIGDELRAIQFLLKNLAGLSKNATILVLTPDLETVGPVGKDAKKTADKILGEVETRLTALKADLGQSALLDAAQAKKVDGTADLLAKVQHGIVDDGTKVVTKASLADDQREVVLESIAKTMAGLGAMFVSLQTESVVKADRVATSDDVSALLHEHAAEVEGAVAKVMTDVVERDPFVATVEQVREVQKALGGDAGAIAPVYGVVTRIAKAASMYKVERDWDKPEGDPDKYTVWLKFAPEPAKKMGSFGDRMSAENEALRLNVAAVTKVAKGDIVKRFSVRSGGKGYQVVDRAGKVVADFDNEADAKAEASRLMFTGKNDDGAAAETTTQEETTVAETETPETTAATEKAGAPMRADRLNRFKSTVKMLKEALREFKAGSTSATKFNKVAKLLGQLVKELQVAKTAKAAAVGRDLQRDLDTRGLTEDAPNAGSGVQPDTSVAKGPEALLGDGAPSELVETMKAELAELKKSQGELEAELASVKKTRVAPSTVPADTAREPVKTAKADEKVTWCLDMNDEDWSS